MSYSYTISGCCCIDHTGSGSTGTGSGSESFDPRIWTCCCPMHRYFSPAWFDDIVHGRNGLPSTLCIEATVNDCGILSYNGTMSVLEAGIAASGIPSNSSPCRVGGANVHGYNPSRGGDFCPWQACFLFPKSALGFDPEEFPGDWAMGYQLHCSMEGEPTNPLCSFELLAFVTNTVSSDGRCFTDGDRIVALTGSEMEVTSCNPLCLRNKDPMRFVYGNAAGPGIQPFPCDSGMSQSLTVMIRDCEANCNGDSGTGTGSFEQWFCWGYGMASAVCSQMSPAEGAIILSGPYSSCEECVAACAGAPGCG